MKFFLCGILFDCDDVVMMCVGVLVIVVVIILL